MDNSLINDLYTQYGFHFKEQGENFIVFSFSTGYFHNIEIIYDCKKENIQHLIQRYQEMNYPVNITEFRSLEILHDNLFSGFFLLKKLSEKLKKQYSMFVQEKNSFEDNYQYIPCAYYEDNVEKNDNVIELLLNQINNINASLTILEAAAGYGKTCSVFELMNNIASNPDNAIVPLFIELSKNRNARIFKYVLLDEIDRNFSSLSSELVISEIKAGRVPLIIDGFDELLSSLYESDIIDNEEIEKTQTMLQTIIELFSDHSKAKIIITSRKTSLISGKILDNLMTQIENCPIKRISLKEPTIKDWLSPSIIALFKKKNIPLQQFSNPILLKFIQRSFKTEPLMEDFSIKKIIDDNCIFLLKRESERQDLKLTVDEQEKIFEDFTTFFIDLQISSEEPTFIQEIFKTIIGSKLPEYLNRYLDYNTQPTENEFIGKLTRHVLLDTNKSLKNQIGFVNDFIFGLFLARSVINGTLKQEVEISQDHIDKMCTTYKTLSKNERQILFNKLQPYISNFSDENLIQIDSQINGYLTKEYNQIQLDGVFFENFNFTEKNQITNSIFSNCIFINCKIDSNITKCQFIDCSFFNTNYIDSNKQNDFVYNLSNFFYGCKGIDIDYTIDTTNTENDQISIEKKVLEQFWKTTRNTYDRFKHPKTIFLGLKRINAKQVALAIENLKKEQILLQPGYCLEINKEQFTKIKEILGR